ncbi:MAG: hypothetical protein LBQ55_11210 [Treponema sp.]|jgi:hypothetical protein|nr:hypothetical protein [Treponema sp.]
MLQIYFLSIFLNALAGYVLIMGDGEEIAAAGFRLSIDNETFRLVMGILTVIVGVLKLLSPVAGDVLVAGDLIPALSGFAAGFVLVFGFFQARSGMETEKFEKIKALVQKNKKWVGFAVIAAAILHFMFPSVLFL